jgi:hypothetical protein
LGPCVVDPSGASANAKTGENPPDVIEGLWRAARRALRCAKAAQGAPPKPLPCAPSEPDDPTSDLSPSRNQLLSEQGVFRDEAHTVASQIRDEPNQETHRVTHEDVVVLCGQN